MITGTFTRIPKKVTSHSYGWAKCWSENLGVPLNHTNEVCDTLYLLHGANHVGETINLFGGYTEELENSIENLLKSKEIISLEKTCPGYGVLLEKRKDVLNKSLMSDLTKRLSNVHVLEQTDLDLDCLAVGDSHTAAYSSHGSAIIKRDGTTLFGQIKDDFSYIRQYCDKKPWKKITLSLGNIDIRHHILRNYADWRGMLDQLKQFGDNLGTYVEYSAPWPVEFEGRRLPKSGYYKGTPFFGSQSERAQLVNNWISYMYDIKMNVVQPPETWYTMHPEEYANTYMEKPQSVHLSSSSYRRENWGIQESPNLESFF